MTPKIICLHHNDQDGHCAGAIVRHRFGDAVALHEIDYGLPVPWDALNAADTVILTDFSLPRTDMETLYRAKGENFIWIDHHISAMNDMADLPLAGRRSLEKAGCVLTWEYFFPDDPVPPAVKYVGDRDIWRFDYPQTRHFCEGLFATDITATNDALWKPLLQNDTALVEKLIDTGKILLDARLKSIAHRVENYGFEMTFEGYRTLVVNMPSNGDVGHHICGLGYDVAYVYSEAWRDGQVVTKVTLYSETTDVSRLAKAHGGGGHKGAAGFQFVRAGNSPLPPDALG